MFLTEGGPGSGRHAGQEASKFAKELTREARGKGDTSSRHSAAARAHSMAAIVNRSLGNDRAAAYHERWASNHANRAKMVESGQASEDISMGLLTLAEVGPSVFIDQTVSSALTNLNDLVTLISEADKNPNGEGYKIPTIQDVIASLQKLIDTLPPAAKENLEGDGDGDKDSENVIVQSRVGEALRDFAGTLHYSLYEKQFSDDERSNLAKQGKALPGGGFPIPDLASLKDAMQAYGRAKDKSATKALLLKRAKELKAGDEIISRIQGFKEAAGGDHDDDFDDMSPSEQKRHLVDDHDIHSDSPNLKIPARRYSMHADKHGKKSSESFTHKPIDLNGDTIIPLTESAIRPDGTAKLKLISPGWGTSGYYSRELLERDGPKIFTPGLHMYWDHPTSSEERERPERSLKDLTAVLESPARWEDGEHGSGLYADAKIFKPYHGPVNEMAPHIGVSIRAQGRGSTGTIDGRKGTIIEEIVSANSVDFVTMPGRGGKILPLFESYRGRNVEDTNSHGEFDMTELEEARRRLAELETANRRLTEIEQTNARLSEALMLRDARDMAADVLSKVDSIPAPSRRRLVETVSSDPPTKDGKLDRDKFTETITEAVKAEAKYLQEVIGTGTVRGMGTANGNSSNDENTRKELAEAFQTLGLSEASARLAANGRR